MAAPTKQHGHSLKDESLRTLLCEAEAVVNSRPLTTETLSYPPSPLPLSPSTLLTGKTKLNFPLQESFNERILTANVAGGAYSILLTISGIDGVKNIFRSYS